SKQKLKSAIFCFFSHSFSKKITPMNLQRVILMQYVVGSKAQIILLVVLGLGNLLKLTISR
ncbi:hypothetical protein, partial [Prevotellamassilia timonensis]|uniref:hypothetical protein n=1 Tax=Prevotellamassilia timonensis TaxID=1852370 RepID=UPI00307C3D9A